MTSQSPTRRAGLLVPLFSMPATRSWGIGEFPDVLALAAWQQHAGLDLLQLLPLNEMAPTQQSPYSAISAMAVDPLYIALHAVEEFSAIGGEAAMDGASRRTLARVRASKRVDYASVRRLKGHWLRVAFEAFRDSARSGENVRAHTFRAYVDSQSWWLDDYALFRALHAASGERPWQEWEPALRDREPAALEQARRDLEEEILYRQYLQWLADEQWQAVRGASPVSLFGDLPFMVDTDSADVWAHQELFRLDATVGVPPDAFSATGQDWGMPVYRWDVMHRRDDDWLRARARRSAALFDGYRVDHLVGFYRTYCIPKDGSKPAFTPAEERDQLALGERMMRLFREPGTEIVAEDLGTVPDFVRESLARQGVPGYRVLRWEREWKRPGKPFRDPARYPAASVATTGTHDTEPAAVWWDQADREERTQLAKLPALAELLPEGTGLAGTPFTPALRDALLEILYASGSNLLILPVQDVFGWRDRVNLPAAVSDENWTYRLPWPVDRMGEDAEARERQDALACWSERHHRGGGSRSRN